MSDDYSASSVSRVLIIRLSAIGDVVFASPLAAAIQNRFPRAQIDWLAEDTVAPLIQHHPDIHEVIIWPRKIWSQHWRRGRLLALLGSVLAFRKALNARHYELVVDAQGLLKSAVLGWLSGAPRRVSFRSKEPTSWLVGERIEKDVSPRISSEYRALAQYLGCDTRQFPLRIALPDAVLEWLAQFRRAEPYVVLSPFTTRPQKHWPEAHWRQLADEICQAGWRVVVLGAPADVESAERIFDGISIESMVGKTTLLESAALVSGAQLVIGVDTGLTHMGWAFSVPTIALFGSTFPYRAPEGLRGEVLYRDMACSPCRRKPTCGGSFDCLGDITVEQVIATAKRYYSTSTPLAPVIASSAVEREFD